MKNIGLKLKRQKEKKNGLSIEEVAEDLKMRPSQITSIEEGKTEDFKDVFYLKYFIRDYAKYLGLDSEKLLDEFNEYLFDITSKIPIDLIEQAKKEKKESNEAVSPYTKETKKIKVPKLIIGLFILIVLIVVGYIIASNYKGNDFSDSNITYSIRR
ncbi:MAG: helix-turn-helix domain-containing protein [Bacilli bacterium]|nr:MAG: helix-turn-helix domain-containing protein [Bacilli bacterium]